MKAINNINFSKLKINDIDGRPVEIGSGKKVWLSLFREANCPFCNFRVYELTHKFKDISQLNIEIVAVFNSDKEMINKFIAKHPRPFRMVSDKAGDLHRNINLKSSRWGKIKAMMLRLHRLLRGMKYTGIAGMRTNNIMPADILLDEYGEVVSSYFGTDVGDHVPMEQVVSFARKRSNKGNRNEEN